MADAVEGAAQPAAHEVPALPQPAGEQLASAAAASAAAAAAGAADAEAAVEALSAGVAAAQVTDPEAAKEAAAHVRRTHVEKLEESGDGAHITVQAAGYEHMLSPQKWEEMSLPASVVQGVYAKGWERPSKIQAQALPYMLRADRPNMLAQAKNGAGKTGAFGLAMLANADPGVQRVQALCMSPTRELAIQTTRVLQQLGAHTGLQVVSVIGGVRYTQPISAHIVVGTPGKLCDVLKTRLLDLGSLRLFVLDEADDMIENFAGDCMFVKRAACMRRAPPQTLLFSASFECLEPSNPLATRAKSFTDQIIDRAAREPVIIRVTSAEGLRLENVTHFYAPLTPPLGDGPEFDAKLQYLLALYDTLTVGKTMIFVSTRAGANTLAAAMRAQGHAPSVITGAKDVAMEERVRVQEEFEKGVTKVLICTDLLTRGIDVPGMKLVVNFDLPFEYVSGQARGAPKVPDFATFQHRSGRVGRFGQVGCVLHLITNGPDMDALSAMVGHFAVHAHELPASSPEEASQMVEGAMTKPLASPAAAGGAGGAALGAAAHS